MGDVNPIDSEDGEEVQTGDLHTHTKQMKLSHSVAMAAVIGGSLLIPYPAEANGFRRCWNCLNH
tara:strand:- start:331 stop:522 length:192 start_codon:yes stop_codon:yes gene_type:complete